MNTREQKQVDLPRACPQKEKNIGGEARASCMMVIELKQESLLYGHRNVSLEEAD